MPNQKSAKRTNKIKARYLIQVLSLAIICVLFSAAGAPALQDASDKESKAKKETKKDDYVYDPTGKTDPFKSFIAVQEAIEDKKRKKPRTYLETLDISQLDLIAIIVGPKGNYAMVRDAKGLGYVIREGTPIGIHDGVVSQINEHEVIIREMHRGKGKNIAKELSSLQ